LAKPSDFSEDAEPFPSKKGTETVTGGGATRVVSPTARPNPNSNSQFSNELNDLQTDFAVSSSGLILAL